MVGSASTVRMEVPGSNPGNDTDLTGTTMNGSSSQQRRSWDLLRLPLNVDGPWMDRKARRAVVVDEKWRRSGIIILQSQILAASLMPMICYRRLPRMNKNASH